MTEMVETSDVLSFGEVGSEEQKLAGGKGATLARLYQAGHPVPDGFVILPAAFVGDELTAEGWARVRQQLGPLRENDRARFAVRSSALAEDSAVASFAGQFETVLGVRSPEEIRNAILTVRRSRKSERVQAYSRAKGIESAHEMAVIVQRIVPAAISGVLFTADPVTGSRAEMTGSFVHGLGDRLVSGEVTGEAFTLSRARAVYAGPDDLERHARGLFRLGDLLEKELGHPQDIEWAIANGKLFLLQSRAITTLIAYHPSTGEWNDSLAGDFLWSNVNFGEAVSSVMTPLTWTVIRLVLKDWMFLPGYHSSGNIAGRPYLNLSVFATVFHTLGKGTRDLLETLEPTVYTRLPEGMEIPLLAFSKWSAVRHFPRWSRIEFRQQRGVRALSRYVDTNPAWCQRARASIRGAKTGAELLSLWHSDILPHVTHGVWVVLGSASHFAKCAAPLRRELSDRVGPEDADALMSSSGSTGDLPANLGPLVGIEKLAHGEMDREAYLDQYGHRGPHEFELSIARPIEDPDWVDHQVEMFQDSPVIVQVLLRQRRARFEAAWDRFRARYPHKARSTRRRIHKASARSRMREAARSEYVRDRWIVRLFALRVGELTGLRSEIFFLTINELLEALSGDETVFDSLPARRETHRQYSSLPPYPSVIRGRFDPFQWAADPDRRSDVFDSHTTPPSPARGETGSRTLSGAAGSAGRVEGTVRRLDSPTEGDQLKLGEILVTKQTDIEWTLLFPLAAAIVTDVGAPLSHAAIVARELGIPAVVGCGDATMRLHTGDPVAVDGGRGIVRILEGS